jgi:hypothetical protein
MNEEEFGLDITDSNYFCNDCKYCIPKEYLQTNKKENHMCKLYNVKLFHKDKHPKIFKCSMCMNMEE